MEMVPGISRARALNFASHYSCPKSARAAALSFAESSSSSSTAAASSSSSLPPLSGQASAPAAPLSVFQLMMAQARAPPTAQENARARVAVKRKVADPMHGFQLAFNSKRNGSSTQLNSQATDFSEDLVGDGSNMSVHSSNSTEEAGKGKHVQHKKLSQYVYKMLVSEDPNELLE